MFERWSESQILCTIRSNERRDRMDLSMTFCGQTYISDENFKCLINGCAESDKVQQRWPLINQYSTFSLQSHLMEII